MDSPLVWLKCSHFFFSFSLCISFLALLNRADPEMWARMVAVIRVKCPKLRLFCVKYNTSLSVNAVVKYHDTALINGSTKIFITPTIVNWYGSLDFRFYNRREPTISQSCPESKPEASMPSWLLRHSAVYAQIPMCVQHSLLLSSKAHFTSLTVRFAQTMTSLSPCLTAHYCERLGIGYGSPIEDFMVVSSFYPRCYLYSRLATARIQRAYNHYAPNLQP